MLNGHYKFSSTQINLPKDLANEIKQWGMENIKNEELFVDPDDPTFGRVDEIHVTILYGLHTRNMHEIKRTIGEIGPFSLRLGKVSKFINEKFDVVKIEVESGILRSIHGRLQNGLKNSEPYPYSPHVTIAYVKKGKCNHLIGEEYFVNKKWKTENVVFCSNGRGKYEIPLQG